MTNKPTDRLSEVTELTDDLLPVPFVIDDAALAKITKESKFLEIGFELAKETGHWLTILSGLAVPPMELNPAIIRAHTVRLSKLVRTVVREMIQDEPAQQLVLIREIIETAATLAYLLGDTDGTRFAGFVQDCLVAEREMAKEISANVASRGGSLDIEERMMRSIQNTATAAGISDVLELPARKKIDFPNAEERIKLLGPTAYVAYRAASSEVHGTWTDLHRNHLTQSGGKFLPNLDSPRIRPQPPLAMTFLIMDMYSKTLDRHVEPHQIAFLKSRFEDLAERTSRVDAAHEKWLQSS